jgi:hypothetical protein
MRLVGHLRLHNVIFVCVLRVCFFQARARSGLTIDTVNLRTARTPPTPITRPKGECRRKPRATPTARSSSLGSGVRALFGQPQGPRFDAKAGSLAKGRGLNFTYSGTSAIEWEHFTELGPLYASVLVAVT